MSKQRYRIREGADTVDGARVPENRIVEMTEQAAAYYVEIGVANLEDGENSAPTAPRKRRSKAPAKPEA